ncbi:hypothetical protein BGZ68_000532, partial [Mortierella alpina]
MTPDGDNKSISSQHERKRDKIRNFFHSAKSAKSEEPAGDQPIEPEVNIQPIRAASIEAEDNDDDVDSSSNNSGNTLETETPCSTGPRKARLDMFSGNVNRPVANIDVPKLGGRINSTPQLALCSSLLLKNQAIQDQRLHDQGKGASLDTHTDRMHLDWIKAIEMEPVEQDHIRWLGTRMVEEFSKDAVKDSAAITEVVLLGPVLEREHYRKLLNCFIFEFEKAGVLDVHLLQGLIQLVQCASEGYLIADDLVKILSILRAQLQNTHQQSTEHPYHLTLAVSRLLDVMAEHKVQDVKRVEEHEPLSEILSSLKNSLDPFLMYQASYAFQALQYVPDDETALEALLRHSAGVANSVVKISGVVKMDLGSVLDGLKGFQEALCSTYDTAK